jgi:aryl-alcohol dehydrogenase-like predicted oxidoreductase
MTIAQLALCWILDHDAVSTIIPGSTSPAHIRDNAAVSDPSPLSREMHGVIRDIYGSHVYDVHYRW